MPRPRGRDDVFELRILRFPAEFVEGFVRGGDEPGRIARAARFFNRRNFFAGDFFAHRDGLGAVRFRVVEFDEAAGVQIDHNSPPPFSHQVAQRLARRLFASNGFRACQKIRRR